MSIQNDKPPFMIVDLQTMSAREIFIRNVPPAEIYQIRTLDTISSENDCPVCRVAFNPGRETPPSSQ